MKQQSVPRKSQTAALAKVQQSSNHTAQHGAQSSTFSDKAARLHIIQLTCFSCKSYSEATAAAVSPKHHHLTMLS